jgi:uncharacterized protein (UPF0333 family)
VVEVVVLVAKDEIMQIQEQHLIKTVTVVREQLQISLEILCILVVVVVVAPIMAVA